MPERRKETDRKYRQAKAELKVWQERLDFRASEWIKVTRKQFDLPHSFTFSIPLAGDISSEERDLQILTTKLTTLSLSGKQGLLIGEEITFRKGRMVDLTHLTETKNYVVNLEKQLMHLGDPVRDTGGYKLRQKIISASIFKHRDKRKFVLIAIFLGCSVLGLYGITLLLPRGAMPGDTVIIYAEFYDSNGNLLEVTPSTGIVLTLTEDCTPSALCDALIGRPENAVFWVDIPGCPSHNCPNFTGFVMGPYAYLPVRLNITVLQIITKYRE